MVQPRYTKIFLCRVSDFLNRYSTEVFEYKFKTLSLYLVILTAGLLKFVSPFLVSDLLPVPRSGSGKKTGSGKICKPGFIVQYFIGRQKGKNN